MADVFISFIHEEVQIAEAVQDFVQSHLESYTPESLAGKKDVFLSSDRWAVYAGELWFERIISELREAKVVVSILSPRSVERPWVNFEAGAAWILSDTHLIPLCFGGLTKGTLPRPYSSLQALDLENSDDQYDLIKAVSHYLERVPPPPPELFGLVSRVNARHNPNSYEKLRNAITKFNSENTERK